MDFSKLLDTYAVITWASQEPEKFDYNTLPDTSWITLAFSLKNFGFGEISFITKNGKLYLDTECMGKEKVKQILNYWIDSAISDVDTDPEKHLEYCRERKQICGDHCEVCNKS